jgi:hypothetical protein
MFISDPRATAVVTIIAILMVVGGVSISLLLPGPLTYPGIGALGECWRFVLSLLNIGIGIGLLKRSG